ncbi:MAG: hypothetical protein COA94_00395 [Rickettsiales bacterium]|nr:MAG: hypothetical protein COA94_00395 [Rickettsiales bacterium]
MLYKLIIHLKNIIFFKVIIYVIGLVLLFVLIPIFQESYEQALQRKEKSTKFLKSTALKLDSIMDFEDKILGVNNDYLRLIKNSGKIGCAQRAKLLKNLKPLSEKYKLFEPMNISLLRYVGHESAFKTNSNIKINLYVLEVNFTAANYNIILRILRDIYRMLPKRSNVADISVNKVEGLTPDIISKLNYDRAPGELDVKIKIYLREIVYEK